MERREFLKTITTFFAASSVMPGAFALSSCTGRPLLKDPEKPNIIFITADDLGWKDLGCYGNRNIETPNIDRLAREGMKFEQAFVVSSSCAPSRASFITGQYPHTNGVDALTHIHKLKSLRPFYTTLPSLLSDAGYNTALEGKWHVSPYLLTSWYGYRERLSGMMPKDMWIKSSDKTLEFIERNKDNRFYLEINYMNNHRDAYGEFEFADRFPVDPDDIHVPEYMTLPDWPEIRLDLAKFYSQTMEMDRMIGEVLGKLDELGIAENTLVIFVSDNGPPYPGNKMTLYDRGTGTPIIMRWPKVIKAGTIYGGLTNTIDIMPTVLDAVGIPVPEAVEGISLLPVIDGSEKGDLRDTHFSEMTYHVYYLPGRAARTKDWKYIRNYSDIAKGLDQCNHMDWAHRVCELPNQPWKSPRAFEELYYLRRDPNEQKNLAEDENYSKKLEEMRQILDRHMEETKDSYLKKAFTHDYEDNLEIYEKKTDGEKYK